MGQGQVNDGYGDKPTEVMVTETLTLAEAVARKNLLLRDTLRWLKIHLPPHSLELIAAIDEELKR